MPWFIIVLVSFLSLPTLAKKQTFSQAEITLMHAIYQQHQPNFDSEDTRNRLSENLFLLSQAKQHQPHLLQRQADVGFSTEFHVRRYVMTLLQNAVPSAVLPTPPAPDWSRYSTWKLSQDLPNYPNNNHYTHAQLQQLTTVDLSFLVGAQLTLADLMLEQSMQNRYKLHQGDYALFQKLITQHRDYHHKVKYLAKRLKQANISLANLNKIATAELIRSPMLSYFGVQSQMHGERSEYVDRLKSQITNKHIANFYLKHKADFKHKSNVIASAVLFESQNKAKNFNTDVKKLGFKNALLQHNKQNLFADTQGKLARHNATQWVHQVVFNLKKAQLTNPIRSPKGKWLIAQTHQINFDYYPKESETVRYQATLALIENMAQQRYQQKKQAWLKATKSSI
ncbi:peptidylprolyl isomerase [Pseudoalteromonas sp. MMG005]|uniref:peptidylprolyl isomerase n=1 Tax=Pseudoalteromonas sp. MMG005 TaxID=2822682 RepID=UPI001B39ED00|nr:peptidylprolyl isomerase [Pseudoalteromonas sp. MMG005]MBQ4847501.1 peptidyl-prolyl cis-trans isomerase [Pseudoalteromonas sp. MMG005]